MTSTEDVDVIRYGLREETDMRVCLLNYRKNGTAFLNQFNLSPLRDTEGKLVSRVLVLHHLPTTKAIYFWHRGERHGRQAGSLAESTSGGYTSERDTIERLASRVFRRRLQG